MNPALPMVYPGRHTDTELDHGAHEGRRTAESEGERLGSRLFRDGCPGGETLDSAGPRAAPRILAVRWMQLAPIEGSRLPLATAWLSVLGYHHDLAEPVIGSWTASAVDGGQETT